MTVAFGMIAGCLLLSGLFSVTSKNLIHSVLWLGVTLASTAGIFILLDAAFLAGIQLILYTGGVITLMLFGVMMTDHNSDAGILNPSRRQVVGAVLAGGVFAVIAEAIAGSALPAEPSGFEASTQAVGHLFLTDHLLAFEALSMLLLAAMVGAIVLARKKDAA
jgi:NADH:ubiquinone oxidoreductase subunit 6 (subunit J)